MCLVAYAGEFPRPELRRYSRISGACLDAALDLVPHLSILGTTHPTPDGTCIRDYVHVTGTCVCQHGYFVFVPAMLIKLQATFDELEDSFQ